MRTFDKPAEITLNHALVNAAGKTEFQKVPYDFEQFLGEYVWCYTKWSEDGWDEAQVRIGELVEAAADGETVTLLDEDQTKLREAYLAYRTPSGGTISGPYAPKLRKMGRAIKNAKVVEEKATPPKTE